MTDRIELRGLTVRGHHGVFAHERRDGQDFLVGAENANGEGDMVATLPTEDLRVTSSPPTPGGSYSYELRLRGTSVGIGEVSTEMTGDLLPGVTIVKTPVFVTRN